MFCQHIILNVFLRKIWSGLDRDHNKHTMCCKTSLSMRDVHLRMTYTEEKPLVYQQRGFIVVQSTTCSSWPSEWTLTRHDVLFWEMTFVYKRNVLKNIKRKYLLSNYLYQGNKNNPLFCQYFIHIWTQRIEFLSKINMVFKYKSIF